MRSDSDRFQKSGVPIVSPLGEANVVVIGQPPAPPVS
jgi:hypothetical protein